MQRFGRKVVYVVIGDGVEEEQAAKKVKHPTSCPRPRDDPEVKYKKKKKNLAVCLQSGLPVCPWASVL